MTIFVAFIYVCNSIQKNFNKKISTKKIQTKKFQQKNSSKKIPTKKPNVYFFIKKGPTIKIDQK